MTIASQTLSTIEDALRAGGKLHAFRSGGGLRVVRIEGKRGLVAYGEHPHIEEALDLAARDYLAGGKPYQPDPHFLTGSSKPSSDLDSWVLRGCTFDAIYKPKTRQNLMVENAFEVILEGYSYLETPKEIREAVTSGTSEMVIWSDKRGVVLQTRAVRFANDEIGTSTSVVSRPEGLKEHEVWQWETFRFGRGATLAEAIEAALAAEDEPISRRAS